VSSFFLARVMDQTYHLRETGDHYSIKSHRSSPRRTHFSLKDTSFHGADQQDIS